MSIPVDGELMVYGIDDPDAFFESVFCCEGYGYKELEIAGETYYHYYFQFRYQPEGLKDLSKEFDCVIEAYSNIDYDGYILHELYDRGKKLKYEKIKPKKLKNFKPDDGSDFYHADFSDCFEITKQENPSSIQNTSDNKQKAGTKPETSKKPIKESNNTTVAESYSNYISNIDAAYDQCCKKIKSLQKSVVGSKPITRSNDSRINLIITGAQEQMQNYADIVKNYIAALEESASLKDDYDSTLENDISMIIYSYDALKNTYKIEFTPKKTEIIKCPGASTAPKKAKAWSEKYDSLPSRAMQNLKDELKEQEKALKQKKAELEKNQVEDENKENLNAKKEVLKNALNKLQEEIKEKRESISQHEKEYSDLDTRLTTVHRSLNDAESLLQDKKDGHARDLVKLNNRLDNLRDEREKAIKNRDSLLEEESDVREKAKKSLFLKSKYLKEADEIAAKIAEADKNIQEMDATGDKLLRSIEELNTRYNEYCYSVSNRITDMRAQKDELERKKSANKLAMNQIRSDVENLEETKTKYKKEGDEYKARIAKIDSYLKCKEEVEEAEKQVEETKRKIEEIKEKKKQADKERKSSKQQEINTEVEVKETKKKGIKKKETQSDLSDLNPIQENNFKIKGDMLIEYTGNARVIKIPNGIKKVGDIFNGEYYIERTSEELIFPEGVEELGIGAMWGCDTLRKIVIPGSVKKISPFVFCFGPHNYSDEKNFEDGFSEEKYSLEDFSYPNLNLSLCLHEGLVFVVEKGSYAEEFLNNFILSDGKEIVNRPLLTIYKDQKMDDVDFPSLEFKQITKDELSVSFTIGHKDCSEKRKRRIPAYVGKRKVTTLGKLCPPGNTEEVIIPETIEKIITEYYKGPDKAFKLTIDPNNQYYSTDGKGLYSADKKTLFTVVDRDIEAYEALDGVEEIGECAFGHRSKLKSLILPDSLKKIGKEAFYDCSSLKEIKGLEQVCSIGESAFSLDKYSDRKGEKAIPYYKLNKTGIIGKAFFECKDKKIESFELPDGIEEICPYAFDGCNKLKEIIIPDTVKSIQDGAFKDCVSLKEIHLPKALSCLGKEVFPRHIENSGALYAGVSISEENPYFSVRDGVLYSKDQSILYYVPDIYKEKTLIVPEKVRTIMEDACRNNLTIQEVIFQSDIVFQSFCFSDCKRLSSIVFHESQTSIGEMGGLKTSYEERQGEGDDTGAKGIFYNCKQLKNIDFKDRVRIIGKEVFEKCGIEEISLPKDLEYIGPKAFSENPIKHIEFPDGLQRIGSRAFSGSEITEVKLPASVINTGTEIMGLKLRNLAIYDTFEPNGTDEIFRGRFNQEALVSNVGRIPGLSEEGCCISVLSAETNNEKYRVYMPSYRNEDDYWRFAEAWNKHAKFNFELVYNSFNLLTENKEAIALERLHHEEDVPEKVKEDMISFIKRSAKKIVTAYIEKNNMEEIQFCVRVGIIDESIIDSCILISQKNGKEEIANYLMNIRTEKMQITSELDEKVKRAPAIPGFVLVDDLKAKKDILEEISDLTYAQMYFRGYKSEIEKLKEFLKENHKRWFKEFLIDESYSEIETECGDYIVSLISEFPQLKATCLVESWRGYVVYTLYSESGYPFFTDYKQSGDFDPKAEGGMGRWAYESDMMQGVSGSYSHVQTGEIEYIGYSLPYKKAWNDLNTCYIEKDGFIYRNERMLTKSEIDKILSCRHKLLMDYKGQVIEEPSYTVELVGTKYEGRIERIEKVKVGDKLTLIREPENTYDRNAINVYNAEGSLGHVPSYEAKEIATLMDEGYYKYEAVVVEVIPLSQRAKNAKNAVLNVSIRFTKPE